MRISEQELQHIVLLTDIVLNGKKKAAMDDMLQCLLYIVKSLPEADLPDSVAEELTTRIAGVESMLREENIRQLDMQLMANRRRL